MDERWRSPIAVYGAEPAGYAAMRTHPRAEASDRRGTQS
jgi:hypothetical protein